MQQLLDRLSAAPQLLGAGGNSSQVQSDACVALLGAFSGKLTAQEVIAITQAVGAVPWQHPTHGEAIMNALGGCPIAGMKSERVKQQDFCTLHHYLTATMWRVLQNQEYELVAKQALLCDHSFLLGLRHPSEPTVRALTALVLLCHEGPVMGRAASQARLQDTLQHLKHTMKQRLHKESQPPERIDTLPPLPQQLLTAYPATWDIAFGSGREQPVAAPIDQQDRHAICRRIQCRSRGPVASTSQSDMGMMCQMFQQMLAPMMSSLPRRPSQQALEFEAPGDIPMQFFAQPRPSRGNASPSAASACDSPPLCRRPTC